MKICVFTDIHANLEALNKLIQSDDFKTADLRICLGDTVISGPYPNECCQALLDNDCIWIMGNHDSYIANGLPEEELKNFSQGKIEHQNYMSNIIQDNYKQIMKKLPKEYLVNEGGKKLYFTHYIWESWDNVKDGPKNPTAESISEFFKDIDADYIFYGHEHYDCRFKNKDKEYVCVSTLGLAYPGNYCMVCIDEKGISIENKTVDFDVEKCKKDIIKNNYPRAEVFIQFLNNKKAK